jgi:hypothetical protein
MIRTFFFLSSFLVFADDDKDLLKINYKELKHSKEDPSSTWLIYH